MPAETKHKTTYAEDLEYLSVRVFRLQNLLKDPHPGLFTWKDAYSKVMDEICEFWNAKGP